jgi:hypothetical protein
MSQGNAFLFQCKTTIKAAMKEGNLQCDGKDHLTIQESMEITFWIEVDSYIEEWMSLPTQNERD